MEGSIGQLLLILIYANELDSTISNAISIKATLFTYKTNILITVKNS